VRENVRERFDDQISAGRTDEANWPIGFDINGEPNVVGYIPAGQLEEFVRKLRAGELPPRDRAAGAPDLSTWSPLADSALLCPDRGG
jgi:hypothetical protein